MKKFIGVLFVGCVALSLQANQPPQSTDQSGKTYPQGTYPGGTYPGETYPGATYPSGTYPKETYPGQPYPTETYPKGTYPGNTYPGETYPSEAAEPLNALAGFQRDLLRDVSGDAKPFEIQRDTIQTSLKNLSIYLSFQYHFHSIFHIYHCAYCFQ